MTNKYQISDRTIYFQKRYVNLLGCVMVDSWFYHTLLSNYIQGLYQLILNSKKKLMYTAQNTLHKKWSFPLRISSVIVTKSTVTVTEEIFTGKLHFLCVKYVRKLVFSDPYFPVVLILKIRVRENPHSGIFRGVVLIALSISYKKIKQHWFCFW